MTERADRVRAKPKTAPDELLRPANGWTPERRARQAELIRTWRPWEHSTGPRTAEGKAKASRNADKGGPWRAEIREVREFKQYANDILRQHRQLLRRVLR